MSVYLDLAVAGCARAAVVCATGPLTLFVYIFVRVRFFSPPPLPAAPAGCCFSPIRA
jgi:hypothetical protein